MASRVACFGALAAGAYAGSLRAENNNNDWLSVPSSLYQLFMLQANVTSQALNYKNAYPTQGQLNANGVWQWSTSPGYGNWVGGFYPGLLFKLMNYSLANNDPTAQWWGVQGSAYAVNMAPNQYNNGALCAEDTV